MASSDEDVPLIQRNQAFFFNKTNPVIAGSDDDDSPLPSWLGQPKPSGKGNTTLIDSDSDSDDVKEVISPVKLMVPSPIKQQQQPTAQQTETAAVTGGASGSADVVRKLPASAKKPSSKKKTPTPAKTTDPNNNNGAGPSQPAGTAATTTAPARPITAGLPVSSATLPVVIPDRIPQIKILLELESTDELHGATDLSGDSGAIGRVLVNNISTTGGGGGGGGSGSGTQQQQLQIDLKGVLYNATVVPCPMTMAIVNIGPTEAKIESLFSEYVQLREDTRFSSEMGVDAFGGLLGDDDEDEHYEAGEEDGGGAGGGASGSGAAAAAGGKKKKAAVAAAPKGKAAGAGGKKGGGGAARKPRASGVKKAKPAARGKGKAKK